MQSCRFDKDMRLQLMAPAPGSGSPEVERETATTAVLNAKQSPGMLALKRAVDIAVQKSKGGVSTIGVYNTSTSSGQLAFYGAQAARAGRIVIITVGQCAVGRIRRLQNATGKQP